MQAAAPVQIGERRGLPVVRPARGSRGRDRFYFGRYLLSPAEHVILTELLNRAGELVTLDRLIGALWSDDPEGGPLCARNIVSIHVHRLRPKLIGSAWRIVTDHTRGYTAERIEASA